MGAVAVASGHEAADAAAPSAAVADYTRALLEAAPIASAYRASLAAALGLPGNILSEIPDARWARLVWTCCAAAGGAWPRAVPIAAAVEMFMVGLDTLDDVEDGEESPLDINGGLASVLNVSTGLLLLAQHALVATPGGAAPVGILLSAGLRACSGQHADVTATGGREWTLDDALAVTAGKSASLVAAICRLGAHAAGADGATGDVYARFGACLGMVLQLSNDIAALHPDATVKTDIALGRPTVPLTYARLRGIGMGAPASEADDRAALWAGGPAGVTWAIAEAYRRRAGALIPDMTADREHRAALAALLRGR